MDSGGSERSIDGALSQEVGTPQGPHATEPDLQIGDKSAEATEHHIEITKGSSEDVKDAIRGNQSLGYRALQSSCPGCNLVEHQCYFESAIRLNQNGSARSNPVKHCIKCRAFNNARSRVERAVREGSGNTSLAIEIMYTVDKWYENVQALGFNDRAIEKAKLVDFANTAKMPDGSPPTTPTKLQETNKSSHSGQDFGEPRTSPRFLGVKRRSYGTLQDYAGLPLQKKPKLKIEMAKDKTAAVTSGAQPNPQYKITLSQKPRREPQPQLQSNPMPSTTDEVVIVVNNFIASLDAARRRLPPAMFNEFCTKSGLTEKLSKVSNFADWLVHRQQETEQAMSKVWE